METGLNKRLIFIRDQSLVEGRPGVTSFLFSRSFVKNPTRFLASPVQGIRSRAPKRSYRYNVNLNSPNNGSIITIKHNNELP